MEADDHATGSTYDTSSSHGFGTTPRIKDGRQVVYTDGACTNNQDDRYRRAGFGVFWSDGDTRNMSSLLPGHKQTNQRAELYAVLVVLQSSTDDIDIHTDSKYVYDGCTQHLRTWKMQGWKIDHADLWRNVDALLTKRQPGSVAFT